jgi:hypothetical protein
MGKRKLMTINDLYNFCLKNNFYHFNSLDNNEEIHVQFPATFESDKNDDKDKEGLTPFVAKAYHDHINLNKSEIKPETLEATLPSAMLRPILASIVIDEETGEKDFGSHDFVIEEDENGNEVIRYIEQPVGVIFGDNTIEYDKDAGVNRAILHGYLFDGYCQDAVDIMNRRKTVDCSVELSVREMSFNAADKVLTLDDFYVSGLTLLGSTINPGMKGSQVTIEDFCEKENSVFSQNDKLIETLEKLNKTLSNFNIESSNEQVETYGKEDIEKVENQEILVNEEVVETEEITEVTETEEVVETEETVEVNEEVVEVENAEETVEESTEEDETEAENTDAPAEDETPEVVEETFEVSVEEQFEEKKLVRTYEISHDDIRYALYGLLSIQEEADNEWYFINAVYDDKFTYENWLGDKIYGQSYTKEDDNVSFNGERWNLHRELLTDSEYAELMSMRANYAALEQFKADTENAQIHAQREEILYDKKYSVLAEKDENNEYKNEAFAKLVSEMDNYSLADLEKEVKSVFADHITNGGQFTYAEETKPVVAKKQFATPTAKKASRYGNLFNKETK